MSSPYMATAHIRHTLACNQTALCPLSCLPQRSRSRWSDHTFARVRSLCGFPGMRVRVYRDVTPKCWQICSVRRAQIVLHSPLLSIGWRPSSPGTSFVHADVHLEGLMSFCRCMHEKLLLCAEGGNDEVSGGVGDTV